MTRHANTALMMDLFPQIKKGMWGHLTPRKGTAVPLTSALVAGSGCAWAVNDGGKCCYYGEGSKGGCVLVVYSSWR